MFWLVELLVAVVVGVRADVREVGVLGTGVLEALVVDSAVELEVVAGGAEVEPVLGAGFGGLVGEVLGVLLTGVSGSRVPATDELAAEVRAALELSGSSPGTVTCGRVALEGSVVREVPGAPDADAGADEVAESPVDLPQAASSSTAIP